MHAEGGKPNADALVEVDRRDRPRRLGRARTPARCSARARSARRSCSPSSARYLEYQPFGVIGVIGPWNYPVLHPDGLDRVRPRGRQRRGVQAERVHARRSGQWYRRPVRRGRARAAGPADRARPGRRRRAHCAAPASTRSRSPARPRPARRSWRPAAESLTPVLLECGGKDAMIVDADADLDAAAEACVWGGLTNAGQTCVGIERVYVADAVYDEFVGKVVARAGEAHRRRGRHRRHRPDHHAGARSTSSGGTSTTPSPAAAAPSLGGAEAVQPAVRQPDGPGRRAGGRRRRAARRRSARRSPSPGSRTPTRPSSAPTAPAYGLGGSVFAKSRGAGAGPATCAPA